MSNIDDLIGKLSNELEPVKRRCPYRNIAIWLAFSVAYIVGVILYYGPKVDLSAYMTNSDFLFEMAMASAILISSAITSSFLSFPDGVQRGWMKGVSLTLFGVFLVWILTHSIEEGMEIAIFTLGSCYKGIFIEAIPFIALIIMTARGHSTQPYWLMMMNVFAVSAIGWIGLRLTCSMYDSMIYGFIHYLLPFAVLGAGIGFFARKIFKW